MGYHKIQVNFDPCVVMGVTIARGVSGCLLDTLFQFWTPYFTCHLHVQFGHPVLKFPANMDTLFLNRS